MKLSKSKINTFRECRRRFKYIYIDEMDAGTNKYAELGLKIHEYAENVGKILKEIEDPTEKDILAAADRVYSAPIHSEYRSHIQGVIRFFIDVLINGNYRIFDVEQYIYDEEHNISGIIDIVLEDKETGELIIIDYKTGKTKAITPFRLELCIYKILLKSKYSDREVSSAGIFFTKGQQYRVFNFVEEQKRGAYVREKDYQAVLRFIKHVGQQIQDKKFYPKQKMFDYFCLNFCPFKDQCFKDGGF